MPRANRHFVPQQVWHLTQRCLDRAFLLHIAEERDRWCYWLRETCRRHGLCVLNYIVTSNHIHLLVEDQGDGEIARSMQLVAGRMGQEYNRRHSRSGPFWQDRYHATAVESGAHLARCVVYIDRNMVRANEVADPCQWRHCGFHEIRELEQKDHIVNRRRLSQLLGLGGPAELRNSHIAWHDSHFAEYAKHRIPAWSNSLAIGSPTFVQGFKSSLGAMGLRSKVSDSREYSALHWIRERAPAPADRPAP